MQSFHLAKKIQPRATVRRKVNAIVTFCDDEQCFYISDQSGIMGHGGTELVIWLVEEALSKIEVLVFVLNQAQVVPAYSLVIPYGPTRSASLLSH
jgi:hypothetical protein